MPRSAEIKLSFPLHKVPTSWEKRVGEKMLASAVPPLTTLCNYGPVFAGASLTVMEKPEHEWHHDPLCLHYSANWVSFWHCDRLSCFKNRNNHHRKEAVSRYNYIWWATHWCASQQEGLQLAGPFLLRVACSPHFLPQSRDMHIRVLVIVKRL